MGFDQSERAQGPIYILNVIKIFKQYTTTFYGLFTGRRTMRVNYRDLPARVH